MQAGQDRRAAAGIAILDGVYNDVKNLEGFLAECEQGRQMGFDGKTLIHPGQVEGANRAFAPSEQAVEDARGLIEVWEDARRESGGAAGLASGATASSRSKITPSIGSVLAFSSAFSLELGM